MIPALHIQCHYVLEITAFTILLLFSSTLKYPSSDFLKVKIIANYVSKCTKYS